MKSEQIVWRPDSGWSPASAMVGQEAQWVLVLGASAALRDASAMSELRSRYPHANIVGCSTAGEICGTTVCDDTLVATAVHFQHTQIGVARAVVDDPQSSFRVGTTLAKDLSAKDGLVHVMVLADGLTVNGTSLAKGLQDHLPPHVAVTGGLAGDADRFQTTLVCADDLISDRCVVAIGFYGNRLHIGYGSQGGWDCFGPQRLVTRSEGNVLYELDGQSALELYKHYLGDHAAALPASALLFPLALSTGSHDRELVRTVLSIDKAQGSMTFAGDIPQGAHVRSMMANFDRLIDGAAGAAHSGLQRLDGLKPELGVLISCVGRKLVLKQRIEEEVESVREVLGPQAVLAGFYSYGEICPQGEQINCQLHNQTMTITTFAEQ